MGSKTDNTRCFVVVGVGVCWIVSVMFSGENSVGYPLSALYNCVTMSVVCCGLCACVVCVLLCLCGSVRLGQTSVCEAHT